MSDKFIQSAISDTQKKFEAAKRSYNNRSDIIASSVDASIYSADQLLAVRKTIKESIEVTRRFHEECESLIIALDAVCRPYLNSSIVICDVGDIVTLLTEITKEMRDASTSVTVSGNGSHIGELGTVSAEASVEVKAILQVWELHYRAMPEYYADQKRIAQAKIDKKNAIIEGVAQDILIMLEGRDWVTAAEIHEWEIGERKDVSHAITILVRDNRIQRLEKKHCALFALPGIPFPQEEPKKVEEPIEEPTPEPAQTEEPDFIGSKPKKKVLPLIIVIVAILAIVAATAGITHIKKIQEEEQLLAEQERRNAIVLAAIESAIASINNMDGSLADFDEETKAVLKDAQISVYNEYEVRLAIVDKISALYKEDNFNGLIDFFVFLCSINADDFSVMTTNPENTVYDICFTSDFIDSFRAIVSENGVALESSSHIMDEYTYEGLQFGFYSDINDRHEERFYIKVYHSEDSSDFDYVIISGEIYRRLQNEKYNHSSPGYFLVGETIELIEEENETSEDDANKYYPAARCPKCGISFRANTMRARKIAEHGYCGMGLCSKD